MLTIRKSEDRGRGEMEWLKAKFSFSFSNYYDPNYMGFGHLRVINDDQIAANSGFGTHPHQDMEILTFMKEGVIEHKDSMDNTSQLKEGEIQLMSAGTGVLHSEVNPQSDKKTKLLQIWVEPNQKGLKPNYQELNYKNKKQKDALTLLVSPTGEQGSLIINQSMKVYLGDLSMGKSIDKNLSENDKVWIQVVAGQLTVNGVEINEGDGLAIENESQLQLVTQGESEFLFFEQN